MSNKTQLQTNNTQLASLIQTLQGKATGGGGSSGGGGSVETCTVTFVTSDPVIPNDARKLIYVGADGQAKSETWMPNKTAITVIKGSHIVVAQWTTYSKYTNANELYFRGGVCGVYQITGDSTFTYVM